MHPAMKKPKKIKKPALKLVYKQAEGISEEEMQRRLNAVFDILLDEVAKRKIVNILVG